MLNADRHIRTSIILFTLLAGLKSPDSCAQVKSGYKGGINLTSMEIKNNGSFIDTELPVGIHFGMMYEFSLTKKFAFQPGFLLSSKGTDYKLNNKTYSIAPTYFELPAHSVIYFGRRKFRVSFIAGPYLSTAIGGYVIEETGWKDLTFGRTSEKDLRLFDTGIDLGINLNISDFVISFQYGKGLRNISPKDEVSIKNRVAGISIGTLIRIKK